MTSPGNGDAPGREFVPETPSLPPQREADTAPQAYPPPAYEPPPYDPPAYQPPPVPSAPPGDAASGQPAKPAQTYTVWSSTPGQGQHLDPKE